ncbi:MAG: GntR family transcriptional regulator [Eubacteriales bacterium]|nr:GntR family transcriptional regulator [Eubacteriales bacterium]
MNKLIKERSLARQAYDQLIEMIRSMKPGQNRLPSEDELSKSMGISRATVREALKSLMLDKLITTVHGRGTFAHPSVLQLNERIDRRSDFFKMLNEQYANTSVDIQWKNHVPGNALCKAVFGEQEEDFLESFWSYIADDRKMLFCHFYFPQTYLKKIPAEREIFVSLPKYSEACMKEPIVYCSMKPRIRYSQSAAEYFSLPAVTPLQCWEEKIYDIEDRLVGVGEVFMHPENMEVSVVTKFEF